MTPQRPHPVRRIRIHGIGPVLQQRPPLQAHAPHEVEVLDRQLRAEQRVVLGKERQRVAQVPVEVENVRRRVEPDVDGQFLSPLRVAARGLLVEDGREEDAPEPKGGAAGFGVDAGCYGGWVADVEADAGCWEEGGWFFWVGSGAGDREIGGVELADVVDVEEAGRRECVFPDEVADFEGKAIKLEAVGGTSRGW